MAVKEKPGEPGDQAGGLEFGGRYQPDGRSRQPVMLTEAERRIRRRNRRWLLLIVCPSIAIVMVAIATSGVARSNQPSGPHVSAPAGFKVVNNGYFSYVVPSSWSIDPANTDAAGDMDIAGSTGWAGEHIAFRSSAPPPGEPVPAALEAFGVTRPQPYRLSAARPARVPGAAVAYEYTATRPGGPVSAVDAWDSNSGVEMWLVVDAPAAVARRILASLRA